MQRFRRVLVYLRDGMCDVGRRGVIEDLVTRNRAELTLIATVDEPSLRQQLLSASEARDRTDALEREIGDRLRTLAESLGPDAAWSVDRGVAAIEVVTRVIRDDHDLVITIDDATPPAPETRRLLRKCPCPVWVLRSGRRHAASCVVAAVNPSPDEFDLNRLILELSSSIAERTRGHLVVAHAWEMLGSVTKPGRTVSGRLAVAYDDLTIEARGRHADALDELLRSVKMPDVATTVELVHGPAKSVITDVVTRYAADLLVMGTVARRGIAGFLIGNTAEQVLSDASCSLMAVKPRDFVSPIRVDD